MLFISGAHKYYRIINIDQFESCILINQINVRCVLVFLLLYSFKGFFVYFPLHVHVYIRVSGPQMNTSAIYIMVYRATN
jgi:hypothetical protein